MPISLETLPYDVLFSITENLDLSDTISLCHSCHQLKLLLDESTLCRKTVEVGSSWHLNDHCDPAYISYKAHASRSKEALLARRGDISYSEAMRRIHRRRDAFSRAHPFSARVVGRGKAFLYQQGILCVLDGSSVKVTDIHASSQPYEINLSIAIPAPPNSPISPTSASEPNISLMSFSDHVLILHCERQGRSSSARLWAIRTDPGISDENRLIRDISLDSSHKLFARNTGEYLYYGTYTGRGDHGHHEWQIFGISLERIQRYKPLQLEDFFGTDMGSTIAFEIHDGFFYAVSNQTSFDVEEVDWTSFYHVIRFPIDNPVPELMAINPRVYRRQHAEGPIHDSWLDLTIQFDEKSNEPVIVEARREWQMGSSRQLRTYYMSEVKFNNAGSESSTPSGDRNSTAPLLPLNDPRTHLIGSSDRPNYAPVEQRYDWQVHPEFGPGCQYTRSFILARTKFKGYNYSANSFIDLVEDDRCCETSPGSCLRIRVGTRHDAPLNYRQMESDQLVREKVKAIAGSSEVVSFKYPEINMWPPRSFRCPCSAQLHGILNPAIGGGMGTSVSAVMDERSLVYMVKSSKGYGGDVNEQGTIVLLSFDDSIECPNPQRRTEENAAQAATSDLEWRWRPGRSRCKLSQCRRTCGSAREGN